MPNASRRAFLTACALSWGVPFVDPNRVAGSPPAGNPPELSAVEFTTHQRARREELWKLLGDLPPHDRPLGSKLLASEKHPGFTLERLELDLNGLEPVPALLLIPDKRAPESARA